MTDKTGKLERLTAYFVKYAIVAIMLLVSAFFATLAIRLSMHSFVGAATAVLPLAIAAAAALVGFHVLRVEVDSDD